MMLKLIRFARGYVDFTATGKFPERFLNLTTTYGIVMWNAHPIKGGLKASMYISDYRRIRRITRKSKLKSKINQKHGFPFFAEKYKSRSGLLVGGVLGLVITLIFSNFLWSVSIKGTENISQAKLTNVLAKNGIKNGVYKNNLDVQTIERNVMLEISEIGWMSINLLGSTASVEVKEKTEKPEINTNTAPCNIKAKKDGVITKINARKGATKVLKGSGVTKGDLLVSGICETKLNTLQYVHAEADVYADVISKKELYTDKNFDYYSITENKIDRKRACFLWAEIPVSLSFNSFDDSVFTQKNETVVCNEVKLPMGIKTETQTEILKSKVCVNTETAQKNFDTSLMLYEVFEKGDSVVISRDFRLKEEKNGYSFVGSYVFNENIAESVDFSVTE